MSAKAILNTRLEKPALGEGLSYDLAEVSILATKQEAKQLKKAARILRELSRDAARVFPLLPVPGPRMMRCLLQSHYCGTAESNWRQAMQWTLSHIKESSKPGRDDSNNFFELDGKTPLFPNAENFSLAKAHLFACTVLRFLNTSSAQ